MYGKCKRRSEQGSCGSSPAETGNVQTLGKKKQTLISDFCISKESPEQVTGANNQQPEKPEKSSIVYTKLFEGPEGGRNIAKIVPS